MFWPQESLAPWLHTLRNGGIAAAPAEGAYGYVADPFNPESLNKIIEVKQRSPHKGLIVLLPSLAHLPHLTPTPLTPEAESAITTYWKNGENPVTLLLPAHPKLPPQLTGNHATIALRLPKKDYMLEYLSAFGAPLVSTSLNLSGQPPATHAEQLPVNLPALVLKNPLPGVVSSIYNPMENKWLR